MKGHKTRESYHDRKTHEVTATVVSDAKTKKWIKMQELLPKVKWSVKEIMKVWRFRYRGSIFEVGGNQMTNVRSKIARTTQRFGKMKHLW